MYSRVLENLYISYHLNYQIVQVENLNRKVFSTFRTTTSFIEQKDLPTVLTKKIVWCGSNKLWTYIQGKYIIVVKT